MLGRFPEISGADWLATLTQFTAQSIVDAYERFVFTQYEVGDVVVGGGGAYNQTLMNTIDQLFHTRGRQIHLKTHTDFGIHDKYKEALAFAILAWASLLHRPNNIPECTGASHPAVLGKHILP
jgi:anhydro-N-acetylmuramic acid kinase